ncbi:MAG: hypothetical protein NTX24_01955 [Candidatus Pacearchaeota archaeon]|nr:hypothetical protein [Candidatus Pacearchaeota archaeon]
MRPGPPPIGEFLTGGIGVELIYSAIIIICSLMIYFATKEMDKLTSYKGIKYFRLSFLFFAFAYFFRYFIQFFLFSFGLHEILEFSPMFLGAISLFVFLYFSTMAVFFLLYSVMWKKWNHSKLTITLLNIFALIISFVSIFSRGIIAYLIINFVLLLVVLFILLVAYNDSKKKSKTGSRFIIYLLLSIFWILNVVDILIPKFLSIYQLLVYLISILLFMIILYKVLKKTGD